jgi:putative ABC transport system substrate-binding protein
MRTNGIAVDHLFDHLVASCVDRILNGDNATELPSQNPIKYALVINLKTAKALGITIPASLLLRADEVIE